MPLIRIVSYLNYVNMIRILLPLSLLIPGTLWKSFRISTFLKWISLCRTAILFLILTPESFLICPTLSLCPLSFKSFLIRNDLLTSKRTIFTPSSQVFLLAILLMLESLLISSPGFGFSGKTISLISFIRQKP